jgi:tRNA 2-thiouridine synthesizing protein A
VPAASPARPALNIRVDARGQLCPLPTVKAALALEEAASGDVVELMSDDPATERDLPAWCRDRGYNLLGVDKSAGLYRFRIAKP